MSIETRGWDNIWVPEKVFVERLTPAYNYEYSETASNAPVTDYIENILNGFYAPQNYIQLFYMLPEVFAPVHEIASRVSDAVWQLRAYKNDEVIYNDDNFNRLFSQPNPLNTIRQLVYQAVCYEIVVGKQFFFKNSSSLLAFPGMGSVSTWSNLPGQCVRADTIEDADPYTATKMEDLISRYRIPDATGKDRTFEVKDVLPVVNLSLDKPYNINSAVSMLKGADKAIKNLIPVYEARGAIYVKRGALGFWVSQKKDESGRIPLTPKEKKEVRDELDSNFGITGGKSTVGVTNQPISWERSAMSISELQPFDETLADACAIYSTLRVPRSFVPSKDNSTFNNKETEEKGFYEDVIIPWAKRLGDLWTTWLGIDTKLNYKRYIHADFNHISILQENKKNKADTEKTTGDTALQRVLNGVWSLNNWLTSIGEEEVNLPIYSKKTGEMSPEELQLFKTIINLKQSAIVQTQTDTNDKGTNQEAQNSGA